MNRQGNFVSRVLIGSGLFICLLIIQHPMKRPAEPSPTVGYEAMVRNAAVPIFLSGDRNSAVRQLEALIQNTDIRRIQIYSSDQQILDQVINSSAPAQQLGTVSSSIDISFQGNFAGTLKIDAAAPSNISVDDQFILSEALIKSAIGLAALQFLYFLFVRLKHRIDTSQRIKAPETMQLVLPISDSVEEGSVLIILYLHPEPELRTNSTALNQGLAGFHQRLVGLMNIYGGKILSLSQDRILCHMSRPKNPGQLRQALTFTWGIARSVSFEYQSHNYQIQIKPLLLPTKTNAEPPSSFLAMAELDNEIAKLAVNNEATALVSGDLVRAFNDPTFGFRLINSDLDIFALTTVKRSVEQLWLKQEALISKPE